MDVQLSLEDLNVDSNGLLVQISQLWTQTLSQSFSKLFFVFNVESGVTGNYFAERLEL